MNDTVFTRAQLKSLMMRTEFHVFRAVMGDDMFLEGVQDDVVLRVYKEKITATGESADGEMWCVSFAHKGDSEGERVF